MKIYRMQTKINDYQYLGPALDIDALGPPLSDVNILSSCQLIAWPPTPPEMISTRPKLPCPDFWNFAPYFAIAVAPASLEKVRHFLEEVGELLPFPCKSEEFHVLNMLKRMDCRVFPEETPGHLLRESLEGNIPTGLFRDARGVNLYVSEIDGNPATEFKAFVEHEGMTGLRFREVWNRSLSQVLM